MEPVESGGQKDESTAELSIALHQATFNTTERRVLQPLPFSLQAVQSPSMIDKKAPHPVIDGAFSILLDARSSA